MASFDYGKAYERYDVSGVVDLGLGKVAVHDIFDSTPEFMLDADAVFVDPPYNGSALSSYYTKAGVSGKKTFKEFSARLIEVIKEIDPRIVFVELPVEGGDDIKRFVSEEYPHTATAQSTYYGKSPCLIAIGSKDEIPRSALEIDGLDEEDAIAHICSRVSFGKIADPCMGKGLVAFYAAKNGRRFAGTELNPKRLAVCVERVKTGKRGRIS